MSTIDRILIIVTFATVVWWAISRRRRPRALAALSVGALVLAVADARARGCLSGSSCRGSFSPSRWRVRRRFGAGVRVARAAGAGSSGEARSSSVSRSAASRS